MPEYYEIKVRHHLDDRWLEWFAGMKLTHLEGDVTLLSGWLPDQAAIYGLLERARDLNLSLISVSSGAPSGRESDKQRDIEKHETLMPSSDGATGSDVTHQNGEQD